MPEFYAVLMPSLPEMPIAIVAMIWLGLLLALCALNSGHPRRVLQVITIGALLGVLTAWGNSVYAFVFLMFPAVYWDCGWCWIW